LSIRLRPFFRRRAGGGNRVSSGYFLSMALAIEATATCNASCPYCYARRELRGCFIDVRALDEFLGKMTSIPLDSGRMVKAAVGAVDNSGGEPLLHPRFPELLKSVLRHAKRASVLTNGIPLHRHIDVISSYGGRLAGARAYLLVEPGCAEQLYGVVAAHGVASHVFHGGVAAASLLLDDSVQRELAGRLGGCIVEAGLLERRKNAA